MSLHSVIMAGGSGTRFWPLSRRAAPKQLLAITSDRTMIRETADRLVSLTPFASQWIVCGAVHEGAVRQQLPDVPKGHILVEPTGRNTAPAIGLACIHLVKEDPDAIVAVLPSDAHIGDAADFCRHLARAEQAARAGFITTLGIRPSRPETGYGYIQIGKTLEVGAGMPVHRVERFVEKPDLATAQKYLAGGDYLWNAGIFVFSARQMLNAMERHMPDLFSALSALSGTIGTSAYEARLAELYPRMPSQSIDYGVMEKEKDLAVVPSTFAWSDVGSFAALPEVLGTDEHGNLVRGTALLDGSRDCVVDSRAGRLVAGVGLQGLMIIDTKDALLVIPKDRAQDVKTVLELLKKKGREDLL